MSINEAIKEQRITKNLSLMDVEKATGIRNGSLCRWENGQVSPSITFCIKLAQFYGCTLDELVGLAEIPNEYKQNSTLPTKLPPNTVAFAKEFGDIITDKNYTDISKLYKAITPELRALTLGYIVGLLQSQGVDTRRILNY